MANVDREEMKLLLELVRADIGEFRQETRADFVEVKAKQDYTNGRLRAAEQEIAVLKDRAAIAVTKSAAAGAGGAAALVGVLNFAKWLYGVLVS